MPSVPEAPAGLSQRSIALWVDAITAMNYGGRSTTAAWRGLLRVTLEALDRADAAKARIDAEGMIVPGEKMSHLHPLLRVEKDARAQFMKGWSQLGLSR